MLIKDTDLNRRTAGFPTDCGTKRSTRFHLLYFLPSERSLLLGNLKPHNTPAKHHPNALEPPNNQPPSSIHQIPSKPQKPPSSPSCSDQAKLRRLRKVVFRPTNGEGVAEILFVGVESQPHRTRVARMGVVPRHDADVPRPRVFKVLADEIFGRGVVVAESVDGHARERVLVVGDAV